MLYHYFIYLCGLITKTKTMKTIRLLVLLCTITASSQTYVTINQDARLAFTTDNVGNTSYTANLTFRVSQVLSNYGKVKPITYLEYEYADLKQPFNKFGFGFGLRYDCLIPKVDLGLVYGISRIYRPKHYPSNGSFASWDLTGNIGLRLSYRVTMIAEFQQTKRTDLNPVGKAAPFIYSGKIGFRIKLFDKPLFND